MSRKEKRHLLAELISWAFFPPFIATLFFTFLIFWYAADFGEGLKWIVVVSPFLIIVPLIFFAVSLKLGWISDIDLSRREERPAFLSVFIGSLAVALAVLYILKVPENLLIYVLSSLLVVIFSSIITLYWKISFHTAVTASVITAITILGGGAFSWMFLLILPVGWARVVLERHTLYQVIGGTLIASVITWAVFYLFGYSFVM